MTTAPATFHPHPLAVVKPGDILWTWCSKYGDRFDHVYQPGKMPPLKCLCPLCNPEKEQTG